MRILIDIIRQIFQFIIRLFERLLEKFFDINFFEKLIVLNMAFAFFAIVLPMGKYFIFGTYYIINNPLAVYMIGIVMLMFVTLLFYNRVTFIIRVSVNIYYLCWIVYLHLAREITKAPYEISSGYYINIIASLFYIILSVLSYMSYGEA